MSAESPRQPPLRPGDLTEPQLQVYRAIKDGPRSGGAFALADIDGVLQGPFGGFLLSPALGDALQRLGEAIRYHSSLTPRMRELAILTVAAHHDSAFELYAHEAVGRAVGLLETEITAASRGTPAPVTDAQEIAAVRFTRSLLGTGDVDDEAWAACVPPLEISAAFELIVLVGYYSTLALQMRVLRTDHPPP